jgi:hypothetical protein
LAQAGTSNLIEAIGGHDAKRIDPSFQFSYYPSLYFLKSDAMFIFSTPRVFCMALAALCIHSSSFSQTAPQVEPEAVFTVQAEGQRAILRVLTRAAACPGVNWDDLPTLALTVRAIPTTVPSRSDSAQKDSKQAVFDVLTCEATWPQGARQARVEGIQVPAPRSVVQRIVLVADTGCRMKASENAFQDCNDPIKWPFAQVAKSAAALKPDLVIHIGDIHYRESPCAQANAGCANSPWGYGYDAWNADFFAPAKPLLAAAPWVFVRGNHESCFRAGQGWFRFIDQQPWREARSCNDPAFDVDADYSQPYAVLAAPDVQFIVFDSSKTNGKPFSVTDVSYTKYAQQMQAVAQLTQSQPNSFFMSHHPLLAVAPVKVPNQFKLAGNQGLQSVLGALYPERLFPDNVSVAMHGHVHLFESISFKSKYPVSLVLGNSGSAIEGLVPDALPSGATLYEGAEVDDYAARAEYGFATLDRVDSGTPGNWLLTEYTINGLVVIQCAIGSGKSRCNKVSTPVK